MTPAEQYLARRLADHPAWRWVEGMRAVHEDDERTWRYLGRDKSLGYQFAQDSGRRLRTPPPSDGMIPDLSDPATQGCLIAMLGDRLIALERLGTLTGIFWRVEIWNERAATYDGWKLPGLGEALARAWLAVQGGRDG